MDVIGLYICFLGLANNLSGYYMDQHLSMVACRWRFGLFEDNRSYLDPAGSLNVESLASLISRHGFALPMRW